MATPCDGHTRDFSFKDVPEISIAPTILDLDGLPTTDNPVCVIFMDLLEIFFPDGTTRLAYESPPVSCRMVVARKRLYGVEVPRIIADDMKKNPVIETLVRRGNFRLLPATDGNMLLTHSDETSTQISYMRQQHSITHSDKTSAQIIIHEHKYDPK